MKVSIQHYVINLASSLIIAFFAIGAISLLVFPESRNFYDLRMIGFSELKHLIPGFIALAAGMFFIQLRVGGAMMTVSTSLAFMVFLMVFSFMAPVQSLSIGAFIFSLPAAYSALISLFVKDGEATKAKKIVHYFMVAGIGLLFLSLFVWIFIKGGQAYQPYLGYNGSKISDAPIFSADIEEIWKIGMYIALAALAVFLGLVFLRFENKKIRSGFLIASWVIPGILLIVQVTVFSVFMAYRVKSMIASTYDFGIFTQMFYSMKNMRTMVTTLERSVAISHLDVHFSPIYWLMLPAFMAFPEPETLQVLQVLIAAAGVIPLTLIMRELKTGKLMRMLIQIMYIASPAIITSSMYDLHENCFLAPLLLFVIYFGIKRKTFWLFVFTALTLMVKEDSGLYTFFIGLYFIFCDLISKKPVKAKIVNAIHGTVIAAASVVYFILVTKRIDSSGAGAMFWRYDNINGYKDFGLLGIIISAFQNPSYFFATFFSPPKIKLILTLLATVGFLPLFQRNLSVFLLAAPVIIMNLASTYVYQHELGFQYFYGTGALLLFMAVLAESASREQQIFPPLFGKIRPMAVLGIIGAALAVTFGTKYIIGSAYGYKIYQENPERFISMRQTLASIPDDTKIVATGYLTAHLADREVLYDYTYYNILTSDEVFDYIIIDTREDNQNAIRNRCEAAGYVESSLSTEYILVFVPDPDF
ncbi:MAG: DUF2079 domain-containing protein [Candidatus Izemoplasmatales bacterium]|jgi:uncharacterized membrane protein